MRLFIGISLPTDIRESYLQFIKEQPKEESLRWVRSESLHITLKFLGEVSQEKLPDILKKVEGVSLLHDSFSLGLSGGGVFPSPRNARVFWVGLHGQLEALNELVRDIEEAMNKIGFSTENRDFQAHLSVARPRARLKGSQSVTIANQFSKMCKSYKSAEFKVSCIQLFQSHLEPAGARYEIIQEFKLRKD